MSGIYAYIYTSYIYTAVWGSTASITTAERIGGDVEDGSEGRGRTINSGPNQMFYFRGRTLVQTSFHVLAGTTARGVPCSRAHLPNFLC